jgi:very-short-patch-repair endonuclease
MAYLGKAKVKDMFIDAKPELFRLANNYRNNPTEAEKLLWEHLRKFRSERFVFRRQHPIVFFIADFYCHKIKLISEVDGNYHSIEKLMNMMKAGPENSKDMALPFLDSEMRK